MSIFSSARMDNECNGRLGNENLVGGEFIPSQCPAHVELSPDSRAEEDTTAEGLEEDDPEGEYFVIVNGLYV